MKYMLLLFGDEAQFEGSTDESDAAIMKQHEDFAAWCRENNVTITSGEELHLSSTAKSFPAGGTVTDGPYLEIKEQLGGFYVIEVASENLAIETAKRCPNHGGIELRPVVDHQPT